MKILVTGGAGFIGSNIADACIREGHEVVIVDNLSTGSEKNVPKEAVFYKTDICDCEALEKIFKKESPEVVNHHAAQIDVRASVVHPQKDAEINIIGIINLLEMARTYGVSRVVYAGTGGALYGEMQGPPPDEKTPVFPLSHYGVSKYCGEHYCSLYSRLYNLNTVQFRYANVYGPRQNLLGEAGVVAIFTNALLSGKIPTIYGDGTQVRDFIHVEDVATANLLALSKGEGATINIGTGKRTSINELFELFKKETGFEGEAKKAPPRAGEILQSGLDIRHAKEVLDWSPKVSLREGLKKTLTWARREIKATNPLDNRGAEC